MKIYKPFKHDKIIDLAKLTNRGDNVLHGDVIIIRCDETDMPKDFNSWEKVTEGVLAEGEFSGHAHQLHSNVFETKPMLELLEGGGEKDIAKFDIRKKGNEMYLKVENAPMLLKHQEHDAFRLYPGNYEIGIQQERDPFEQMIRDLRD